MKRPRQRFATRRTALQLRAEIQDFIDMMQDPGYPHRVLLQHLLGDADPQLITKQQQVEMPIQLAQFLFELAKLVRPAICRSCQASGDKARGACWLMEDGCPADTEARQSIN